MRGLNVLRFLTFSILGTVACAIAVGARWPGNPVTGLRKSGPGETRGEWLVGFNRLPLAGPMFVIANEVIE
jgi:hypothetical protein